MREREGGKRTFVQGLGLLEVIESHDGKDAAVAVHKAAHVHRVFLHLARQRAAALVKVHKVARRLLPSGDLGKEGLVAKQLGTNVDELLAGHELQLWVLGQGDANRVAQAVGQQRADADG